jgi:3-hydroxybutyryl-CoA dehydrogenase
MEWGERVAVIGAGTMGNGIAQVFAQAGANVALIDVKDEFLARGMGSVRKSVERMVKKGLLTESDAAKVVARIAPSTAMKDVGSADLVIEAVPERVELKREVFLQLDRLASARAVLASNTSSISITELAAVTNMPERVIGMHFMNPVPVMQLVELIRGLETSDETVGRVVAAVESLGKTAVEARDYPGFVSNRVLMPMINEAVYCLMEGIASKEGIDAIMKLGMNHPMGPLALADFIGLDVCLEIMRVLHQGFGDDKYRPCPLLKKMVAAGHLGRKVGRGFYTYTDAPKAG